MDNLNEIEKNRTVSHEEFGHKKLSSLPEELLMKIIEFLPHRDLSAIMIVDKKFNNLTSDPALWKRYPVPAKKIARQYGLGILLKVLEFPKFSRLEVLNLREIQLGAPVDQKFLNILVLASTLPLKGLDLSCNDLDLSPPYQNFLAKMVLNIQHVEFNDTFTGNLQQARFQLLEKILDGVSGISVLTSIDLGSCDLDQLPTSSIVKLSCLSGVSLEGARMREEQARALMIVMRGDGSNIKKLDLGDVPIIDVVTGEEVLDTVKPEIFAKALNSVEYLRYKEEVCYDLEPKVHIAIFFEEMAGKPTCLKKLDMDAYNHRHVVGPSVIAKAFNKLEYLEFGAGRRTTYSQIVAILELMAEQTNIVHLKFEYMYILWLNPDLMARALVQVERVDIMCQMSEAQIRAVICQLKNNPRARTRRLNLGSNNLSEISEKGFENAVEILRIDGGTTVVTQTRGKKYLSYSSSPAND